MHCIILGTWTVRRFSTISSISPQEIWMPRWMNRCASLRCIHDVCCPGRQAGRHCEVFWNSMRACMSHMPCWHVRLNGWRHAYSCLTQSQTSASSNIDLTKSPCGLFWKMCAKWAVSPVCCITLIPYYCAHACDCNTFLCRRTEFSISWDQVSVKWGRLQLNQQYT